MDDYGVGDCGYYHFQCGDVVKFTITKVSPVRCEIMWLENAGDRTGYPEKGALDSLGSMEFDEKVRPCETSIVKRILKGYGL